MKTINLENPSSVMIAIAWCLAWGDQGKPKYDLAVLQQMRQALKDGEEVPNEVQDLVDAVRELDNLKFPDTLEKLKQLPEKYPLLWSSQIGLIYGGATKIKQYVFEAAKLPDIRGASALLDRINLVDLPAFFNVIPESQLHNYNIQCGKAKRWLNDNFYNELNLSDALIPELIIYSTGGNILAFCPPIFVDDLAKGLRQIYALGGSKSAGLGWLHWELDELKNGLKNINLDEVWQFLAKGEIK